MERNLSSKERLDGGVEFADAVDSALEAEGEGELAGAGDWVAGMVLLLSVCAIRGEMGGVGEERAFFAKRKRREGEDLPG